MTRTGRKAKWTRRKSDVLQCGVYAWSWNVLSMWFEHRYTFDPIRDAKHFSVKSTL
jgi:hypothetical protein